jgi:hypothetical protein
MERHDFVFGTGKSNLFKKRKSRKDAPPVCRNTHPSIEGSPEGEAEDGFENYGAFEEGSVSSNDKDIPANLVNIESFEETGPDIYNPDQLDFGFNNYLEGAKLIQGGLMKVLYIKTDCF